MKIVGLLAALTILGGGCGESMVEPDEPAPIGTLSFVYSGALNGSVSVQGEAPSLDSGTGWDRPFAIATIAEAAPPPSPRTIVRSSTGSRMAASADDVELNLPLTTPGTVTINESCFVPGISTCAYASFAFSRSSATGRPMYQCVIRNGSLTIANTTPGRVAGTFAGSASCLHLQTLQESDLLVAGGVFDVPIIAEPATG